MRFKTEKKPSDDTTFGPQGYTVYRVMTDTAGGVFYAPIADFKYRSDAKIFEHQKNIREKTSKTAIMPWWEI